MRCFEKKALQPARRWSAQTARRMRPLRVGFSLMPILANQPSAAIVSIPSGLARAPMRAAPAFWATKAALEPTGNLLRRPLLLQLGGHQGLQFGPLRKQAELGAACAPHRPLLSPQRAITLPSAAMGDLAAHRRGAASQAARDRAKGLPRDKAPRDLLALRHLQRRGSLTTLTRSDPAAGAESVEHIRRRALQRPTNLRQRLAALPARPQLPPLLVRQPTRPTPPNLASTAISIAVAPTG